MPQPAPFTLSPKLLARHGYAGRVLALPPSALGGMVQLLGERPGGAGTPWALQGRRADCQVWAPVTPRAPKAKAGPACESCDSTGRCAQCKGIGCSVCGGNGQCAVCEGAGELDPADGDGPDSDDGDVDSDVESSSSSAAASGIVRVVSVRGLLASEVTPWECGVMDGYQGPGGVVDRWRQAHADPNAVAVVLDAMAPGGDALLCMESAAEMAKITAASGKPAAVFASEATSAMYALACGAASPGLFFAAPSADVGNVGTRTWHVDRSAKNADDGIVVTHIGDPAGKILGNPDQPLDPKAREMIEADIADSTGRFAALVADRRGISVEAVRALDAKWLRGQAAVDAKLVDAIVPSLADAVARAFAAAMAPQVSPVTTPAPEDDDMSKLSPAALARLGLQPGAKAAAIEAAILAQAQPIAAVLDTTADDPLRALGAIVLAGLGTEDPIAAMVEAPRRLAAGVNAPKVTEQNDALRREMAWDNAIAAGRFFAFEVWGVGGKTKDQGGALQYAAQAAAINRAYPDVAHLEARLATFPKVKSSSGTGERADADMALAADAQRTALVLPPKWAALAAKARVDPARLAQRAAERLAEQES